MNGARDKRVTLKEYGQKQRQMVKIKRKPKENASRRSKASRPK